MKTIKTPLLESLIEAKHFDWKNSNITSANFPAPKSISTDFKLFHFDKNISSEDAIKEMEKEGYKAANVYELLSFDWNDKDWIVALGSVAGFRGGRGVAYLVAGGSGRRLVLCYFGRGWYDFWRFLGVRNSSTLSSLKSSALSPSDTLSLSSRVEKLESDMQKLREVFNNILK